MEVSFRLIIELVIDVYVKTKTKTKKGNITKQEEMSHNNRFSLAA